MMLEEKMLGYEVKVVNGLWRMKENVKEAVHDFFTTEDGDTNFISIIIVLVIVVGLALIFRNNIKTIVNAIWETIFGDAREAIKSGEGNAAGGLSADPEWFDGGTTAP